MRKKSSFGQLLLTVYCYFYQISPTHVWPLYDKITINFPSLEMVIREDVTTIWSG